MLVKIRNSFLKMLLYFVLLLLGGSIAVYGRALHIQVQATIYFIVLAVIFVGRTSDRIVDAKIRRLLTATAWMFVLFFVFQGLKYHVFRENDYIGRWLWYFYYLPILFLPSFSFFVALAVDNGDEKEFWRHCIPVAAISFCLFLLVLTNDFHQFVFWFQPQFQNWDSDYGYGMVYYFIAVWILVLLLGSVVILLRKCHLSVSRNLFWIPLIPILFGMLYTFLYIMDWVPQVHGMNIIEFPETACTVVACFWECCISIGLVPSNKGYEALFSQSRLAAQITDSEGNTMYASKNALELTQEQKRSKHPFWLDKDVFLRRAAIKGGFVYWQNDLSKINAINKELMELEERLSDETELIRLQNEERAKRAGIDEKNRVYDKIAEGVEKQSQMIATLSQMAEACLNKEAEFDYENLMGQICFLGTYVKRYSNLMLLAENRRTLSVGELGLAISESLHALEELGVVVTMREEDAEGEIEASKALEVYEALERLIGYLENTLTGIYVRLSGNVCKVVLEGGQVELPTDLTKNCSATWEENTLYVRFSLARGGDQA